MPAMGGIAERAEIRVMGSGDEDGAARFGDAVKFFHGGDVVRYMFDDVLGAEMVEGIIAEGQAALVQMAEHIGGRGWIHIEANGAGVFCRPTAYVENAWQSGSCGRFCSQFLVSHEHKKDAANKIAQDRGCGPVLFATRLNDACGARYGACAYRERSISVMQASTVRTANSACSSSIRSGGQKRRVVSPEPSISKPLWKAIWTRRLRRSGARSLVFWSRTISMPIIKPLPRTSPTILWRVVQSVVKPLMNSPICAAFAM